MCSAVANKWSGAVVDAGRQSDGAGQITVIVSQSRVDRGFGRLGLASTLGLYFPWKLGVTNRGNKNRKKYS